MAEHSFNLSDRKTMNLTGVINVLNFDEDEIILETTMGFLAIQGEGLHITMLSLEDGRVSIDGTLNNFTYKAPGTDLKVKGKNIINRLFK